MKFKKVLFYSLVAGSLSSVSAFAYAQSEQSPSNTPSVKPVTPQLTKQATSDKKNKTEQKHSKPSAQTETTEDLLNIISASNAAQTTPQAKAEEAAIANPKDPLKGYNQFMFDLNESLDKYVAKPAARLYDKIMPRPLNNMANNFFHNLDNTRNIGNDLLQANFYQATSDSWRFLINSTAGIGGLFDVASNVGLAENENDFGLTLAQWGWTSSSYFVLPVLGPSTIRDALGRLGNYQMSVFPYIDKVQDRNIVYAWYLLNKRVQFLDTQDVYDSAAVDPYSFMRNAYLQNRAYLIKRNQELDNPYSAQETRQYHDPNYLYK